MDTRIASHVPLFDVNAHLAKKAVEGLTDEQLWRRPGDGSNPIAWVLGHIVTTRYGMIAILGGTARKPAWADAFKRGQPFGRPENAPAVSELVQALDETNAAMKGALENATEAQLSAESPFKVPLPDNTLRGAVVFFGFHETYHVGQLAYLRKWLGYPGLVG